MTLVSQCDLYRVKVNHRGKYLRQKSFRSNATVRTGTYTQQSALPGALKWSENIFKMENIE